MTSSEQSSKGMNEDSGDHFKPWRCGDPYNFPLPKTDGDPWTVVLDYLRKKDQVRCEAWKDEVQNLLIFAGLFSAVVTAFVVESCKTLQQDSSDIQTILLSRILSQLDNATTPFSNLGDQSFSPAASNIRVNVLWFLSLVFSLATVLVGIICLQWVREHQRPAHDVSPRIAVSLLQMHIEALERWYVPHFFSALPLLLQVGLVLFFAGLIDFLWHLNHIVAIPVLVPIGLTLLFLLSSTIIPALQNVLISLPRFPPTTTPRSPCPYRSPQSWAFVRLLASFARLRDTLIGMTCIHFTSVGRWFRRTENGPGPSKTWLKHATQWLYQRDLDFMSKHAGKEAEILPFFLGFHTIVPLYDSGQALMQVMENLILGSQSDDIRIAAHNCLEELSPLTSFPVSSETKLGYRLYLDTLLHTRTSASPCIRPQTQTNNLGGEQDSASQVLQDCNSFLLSMTGGLSACKNISPRILGRHRLELCTRITEWMFAHGPRIITDEWKRRLRSPSYVTAIWMSLPADHIDDIDVSPQIVYILRRFFEIAASSSALAESQEIATTTYTSLYATGFLRYAAEIFTRRHPLRERVEVQQEFILNSIAIQLQTSIASNTKCDYLFVAATIYIKALDDYTRRNREVHGSPHAWNYLIPILKSYNTRRKERKDDEYIRAVSKSLELLYNEWISDALDRLHTDTLDPASSSSGLRRFGEKEETVPGVSEDLDQSGLEDTF